MLLGSHVSFKSSDQLVGSVKEALSYGSNTFMFYTGAPQNTKRCDINDNLTKEAIKLMKENNIDINNVVVHAPYIINLSNNTDSHKYDFAINFLKEEIKRVEKLGVKKLVFHPGSFTSLTLEKGLDSLIYALNEVLKDDINVNLCIETMAGKGTEVCFSLDQLKYVFDNVKSDRLFVCLDTCHLNDSGYDISLFNDYLSSFDKVIGIDKIAVVHVNDSKNPIGSKKDRHENIGYGYIGFDSLLNVIYNDKLSNIPFILETPYISLLNDKKVSYPPYKFEIEMIKNKKFNSNLHDDVINHYKK